ncbi:MAG: phosphonate ABC transporter, permease protein PhnE [Gammaproteobacteria bacterium]|nr:phosphonate ABC transporter, permease protein PhnE [Gammaproteobacteria bacterium]MDH3467878.1 phosphonate ABC transporter, permease protein PhnE [Gammaproteobacteria bacterium]
MQTEQQRITADQLLAARSVTRWRRAAVVIALFLLVAWSIKITVIDDTDWERIGSLGSIVEKSGRFLALDVSLLPKLIEPAIETLMIACLGTLLGVVLCIPVIWFGAANVTPFKPVTYPVARMLMTLSRSIHEIVWALFFVAAVGLGALAGVLAIAMRSIGFIAKISAEAIEDIDPKAVEAIQAMGGNKLQVLRYAILPQVLPVIIGVTVFEWEINIRRSAILGLVGAGGLGLVFFRQMNTFNYPGVTTVILAILVLILLGEVLSHYSRKAVI